MCAAAAAPQFLPEQTFLQAPIPILKSTNELKPDQSYSWEIETGNGIQAAENGYLKNAGLPGAEAQTVQGYYQYVGPDNIPIQLTYTADENGFRPSVSIWNCPMGCIIVSEPILKTFFYYILIGCPFANSTTSATSFAR